MQKGQNMEKNQDIRGSWLVPATFVFASIAFYILLRWIPESGTDWLINGSIVRDGYGGEEKSYSVLVEGLEEELVPFTVTVGARVYTSEQAQTVFRQIMDQMETWILGENPSLLEIRSDLTLPREIEETGVRLRWSSSEPEYMDADGRLCRETEQEISLVLTVQLTTAVTDEPSGRFTQEFEIPIRILPQEKTEQERKEKAFAAELKEQDSIQKAEEWMKLPTSYEGQMLQYYAETAEKHEEILVLGILLAALWKLREREKEQEQKKKRERELLLDYAELLSKLMVLIGAGLTTRNAWERIVKDYEAVKTKDKKTRAAYEEMSQTYYQMQRGMPEGEAYREFGQRCRLQPYLKLSSLLEQNRKSGTKNLRTILQTEMADALEQRKNLARRLGEEAGTRLLVPLFLTLGIIMVMIMVPAMITMG